jgi:predicted RNA-binding Zn-ribbon protein involved in translation (DUF1610 family)
MSDEAEKLFSSFQDAGVTSAGRYFSCPGCGRSISKPEAADLTVELAQRDVRSASDANRAGTNFMLATLNMTVAATSGFKEAMANQDGDAFLCPGCGRRLSASRAWGDQYAHATSGTGTQAQTHKTSDSKCFIATAACGSSTSWEVDILREFRDKILLRSKLGRCAVESYYRLSLPLAGWIERNPRVQNFFRCSLVNPLAQAAAKQVARRG